MTKAIMGKSNGARAPSANTETVAQILERERDPLIHEWLGLVEKQEDLRAVPLNYEDRTGHCPNCWPMSSLASTWIPRLKPRYPSRPVITAICAATTSRRRFWSGLFQLQLSAKIPIGCFESRPQLYKRHFFQPSQCHHLERAHRHRKEPESARGRRRRGDRGTIALSPKTRLQRRPGLLLLPSHNC